MRSLARPVLCRQRGIAETLGNGRLPSDENFVVAAKPFEKQQRTNGQRHAEIQARAPHVVGSALELRSLRLRPADQHLQHEPEAGDSQHSKRRLRHSSEDRIRQKQRRSRGHVDYAGHQRRERAAATREANSERDRGRRDQHPRGGNVRRELEDELLDPGNGKHGSATALNALAHLRSGWLAGAAAQDPVAPHGTRA